MTEANLLVMAPDVADARLIADMLREDFERVAEVSDPDEALRAFETLRPDVLVLGFRTLAEAEGFNLGLLRRSGLAYSTPHRTILLCRRADAYKAFERCRKQHFDDYVVFWPGQYDPQRLRMAALLAVRVGSGVGRNGPSPAEFAVHARRMAELEGLLREHLARGNARVSEVSRSIREAEAFMDRAFDGLAAELRGHPAGADAPQALGERLGQFRVDALRQPLQNLHDVARPVQDWVDAFSQDVETRMEPLRALGALAHRVLPVILVVDDDPFQHRLLSGMLADERVELCFAASGAEALALLRTVRPDLILMDFNLPDCDGVDIMQRLKATPETERVPVILITGTSTREVLDRSHAAGAVDFMVKPFNTARLKSGIFQYLAR